ncbi:MAG: response regulator [Myxococcales bacterium]|nr:response regulator [Myxococcales bacterium]
MGERKHLCRLLVGCLICLLVTCVSRAFASPPVPSRPSRALPPSKRDVLVVPLPSSQVSFGEIHGSSRKALPKRPVAQRGVLDARGWPLHRKTLRLRGDWAFFWKKLYAPKEAPTPEHASFFTAVPRSWRGIVYQGKKLPGEGYATYRLRLLYKPKPGLEYGLRIRFLYTAYKLWINGEQFVEIGQVGRDREQSIPQQIHQLVPLPKGQGQVDIVLQVSNFHHRAGGMRDALQVGPTWLLRRNKTYQLAMEIFFFGVLLIFGLYHLISYLLYPKERALLFFSFTALLWAFRPLLANRLVFSDFAITFPWELSYKLEYATFFLGVVAFVSFVGVLFPKDAWSWAQRFFIGSGLGFFGLSVVTPARIYTQTLWIFQIILLLTAVYAFYVFTMALARKRQGALILWVGMALPFVGTINDLLVVRGVYQGIELVSLGFVMFGVAMATALFWRAAMAFDANERLSSRLLVLDKMKDEFLANTSHELRTPLHGMIGLSESLLDGATGELPEATKQNLGLIVSSGRRLGRLIDDILDFSKLKNQEIILDKKPIGIYQLTELVMAISRPLLAGKRIKLCNEVDPDAVAWGDENRVQQILHNLIGNAIKFTDEGRITVSAKRAGEMWEITIEDTGIGIPEEAFERIFRSFEQLEASSDRRFGGTGIGLSVTRQLVELHGGEVRVSSMLGEGSRFTFTLPYSEEEAQRDTYQEQILAKIQDVEPSEEKRGLPTYDDIPTASVLSAGDVLLEHRGLKILLVDDEPVNLQILINQLSMQDFVVRAASSGAEALEIVGEGFQPDLILLDVMMPRMSGFEVCRVLRERYPASELPIVMLTAKNQVGDLVEGFHVGANDYLTKPFSKKELLARIQTHIRLSKINEAYGRFVPHELLRFLNKESILDVQWGDHVQREMTVLFSDIRSFTAMSEAMSPKDTFDFINSYLRRMEPIVKAYKGFIDKFIGDAIMALFADGAEDAVVASIEMLHALDDFNHERTQQGYPAIRIGIGLNTGMLMLGTIGGKGRMDGTVISDAVNLASRVEGMTKVYGASLIATSACLESLPDVSRFLTRPLDRVAVKGKQEAVVLYEIFDGDPPAMRDRKSETLPMYKEALAAYEAQDFVEGERLFARLVEVFEEDVTARLYLERCRQLRLVGVIEGWDGIYRPMHK